MPSNDLATSQSDETRFLLELSKKLSDRQAYHDYASWLNNADPRSADFVRKYSQHAFDGSPVPKELTHRSDSWHRMLGYSFGKTGRTWHESIRKIPQEMHSIIEATICPIVTMTATKCALVDVPLGGSRFLGKPDLPKGYVWPTCGLGPLHFQAQIDLSVLRHTVASSRFNLPKEGWLLLFAFDDGDKGIQPGVVDEDPDGNSYEIPGLTHVEYIPATEQLERVDVPRQAVNWRGSDFVCDVTFGESLDLPWAADMGIQHRRSPLVAEWIDAMRGGWNIKLMGYPMHQRTDNTSPGEDWVNLITLGSDNEVGWSWCDGEHLDVYVRFDGLMNRTFRPIYGYAA